MLQVSQLYFEYSHYPVIKNLSFQVDAGDVLYVRGGNGVGKSTLLKLIAGLLLPTSGTAEIATSFGYVGHKTGLYPTLTVREWLVSDCNVLCEGTLDEVLRPFGLHIWLDVLCGQLSMGLRKRLSLVRLWMSKTQLWLLDEPFVGLDQLATELWVDLILQHVNLGGAVIFTSHQDIPLASDRMRELALL